MAYSYEELRGFALDVLSGREKTEYQPNQYRSLVSGVGEVAARRNPLEGETGNVRYLGGSGADCKLPPADRDLFLEVFWGLFREGVISLGSDDMNPAFPWLRVSQYGKKIIADNDAYFFHDVSTYEELARKEIPRLNATTMLYLKEAMQSFRVGCLLSSSVMLGVAAEHTFNLLLEDAEKGRYKDAFKSVPKERGLLKQAKKFQGVMSQHVKDLPSDVREDLDTNFAGILSLIRSQRNDAGHPTGKIVAREQVYVTLQLAITHLKKMYALRDFYSKT